ncbi:helix-turn-helix transcriptional regulator [Halanaerobaculum tunisiense]
MNQKKVPKELEYFIPLVRFLANTLGEYFELILYEINQEESEASIIAIENSHISNRKVGDKAPKLLQDISNSIKKDEDMILNYITKTNEGRPLKSSTYFIRNNQREIIGAFCINLDLTNIKVAQNFLGEISSIEEEDSLRDKFPEDVDQFLEIIIKNSLEEVGKPVPFLTRDDKLKIVKYLDDNNAFNIKDAINMLADELNVSRYTIYNYLDEVRADKKD